MKFDLKEILGEVPKPNPEIPDLSVDDLIKNHKLSAGAEARFKARANREMLREIMREDIFVKDTQKAHPSDQSSGVYDLPAEILSLLDNPRYPNDEDDSDESDVCECKCAGCASGSCSACSGPSKCKFFAMSRYGVASKPSNRPRVSIGCCKSFIQKPRYVIGSRGEQFSWRGEKTNRGTVAAKE